MGGSVTVDDRKCKLGVQFRVPEFSSFAPLSSSGERGFANPVLWFDQVPSSEFRITKPLSAEIAKQPKSRTKAGSGETQNAQANASFATLSADESALLRIARIVWARCQTSSLSDESTHLLPTVVTGFRWIVAILWFRDRFRMPNSDDGHGGDGLRNGKKLAHLRHTFAMGTEPHYTAPKPPAWAARSGFWIAPPQSASLCIFHCMERVSSRGPNLRERPLMLAVSSCVPPFVPLGRLR